MLYKFYLSKIYYTKDITTKPQKVAVIILQLEELVEGIYLSIVGKNAIANSPIAY